MYLTFLPVSTLLRSSSGLDLRFFFSFLCFLLLTSRRFSFSSLRLWRLERSLLRDLEYDLDRDRYLLEPEACSGDEEAFLLEDGDAEDDRDRGLPRLWWTE